MPSRNWIRAGIAALSLHAFLFLGLRGFLRPSPPALVFLSGERKTTGVVSAKNGEKNSHSKAAPGGGSPEKILGQGDGDPNPEPVLIGEGQPPYPPLSRRLGEEGEVSLLLRIDLNGNVLSATVASSSGFERLDQAALEYGRTARFRMPLKGIQQEVEKRLTLRFVLEAAEKII